MTKKYLRAFMLIFESSPGVNENPTRIMHDEEVNNISEGMSLAEIEAKYQKERGLGALTQMQGGLYPLEEALKAKAQAEKLSAALKMVAEQLEEAGVKVVGDDLEAAPKGVTLN